MTHSDGAAIRGRATATEPTHAAVRDLLAAYAMPTALGADPQSVYPAVALHMAGCADCRVALQDLLELMADLYDGRVAPAPSYPAPDLSFLCKAAGTDEARDLPGRASSGIGSM